MAALHDGAGVVGAFLVAIATGVLALTLGQIAFALVKPIPLRAAIAATFAIPAALAGFHAVLGLSQIAVPSFLWREAFAWGGAILTGGTAWARMTVLAEPLLFLQPGQRGDGSVADPRSRDAQTPKPAVLSKSFQRRRRVVQGGARTNPAR
jgi:hypothetical protein